MISSDQFNRTLAKSLEAAPIEFRRRGKGLYRVSPCKAHGKPVACSAFRQSMATYLNLVDDGVTVVISRRPGMGTVVVYYLVEKVKAELHRVDYDRDTKVLTVTHSNGKTSEADLSELWEVNNG